MKVMKEVRPGEMLPAGYGFAWRNYCRDTATCLPVPINIAAAMLRSIWLFMRHGWRPVPMDPRDAYAQGRKDALGPNASLTGGEAVRLKR